MKKFLLSIIALCMCTIAFAGTYTYTHAPKNGEGSDSEWTYNTEEFTITQIKSGTSDVNATYNELRLYKNHSLEIKANDPLRRIISVTFNCSDAKYATTLEGCEAANVGSCTKTGTEVCFALASPAESFTVTASAGQVRITTITIEYSTAGEEVIPAPLFSVAAGAYYTSQTVEISAEAGEVYYSFDQENYTKYTESLTIDKTSTLSAYAEVNGKKSAVKTATYSIAITYASLDDLFKETPTETGWPVIVSIQKEEIAGFYMAQDKYKNGVYLTRQAGGKNFELYKSDVPDSWNVGDKLTGTVKGIYQIYNDQWEISLNDEGWSLLINEDITGHTTVLPPKIFFDAETKTVTIIDVLGQNTIYYTTDGSEPDDSKTLYEGPFTITKTTTIKAVCYDDDDQKSEVTTMECAIIEAITDLASLKAACTATSEADAPEVTFTLNDIKVTGVNGQNIFVQDATGSFLFFDKAKTAKFVKGDVLSGSVSGKLYSYNNLPELSVTDSWSKATSTAGEAVQPVKVNAADITKADASRFVRFENLTFVSSAETSKKMNYTLMDATGTVVLRDNFGNLSGISFNADCKYNMNVFVIPFKDDIQYYAVDASDIEVISSKADPQTRFLCDQLYVDITKGKTDAGSSVSTQSDGAKTYTSSNEKIATVDGAGIITPLRTGISTLTVTTAPTDKYMEGTASVPLRVQSGNEGTLESPFTAGDIYANFIDGDTLKNVWVKAYIVGYADGSMSQDKVMFGQAGEVVSNIVISDDQNEDDVKMTVPVELASKSDARTGLNLKDHPENVGKTVWLKGSIIKYFSQAGLKNIREYTFDASVINHLNVEEKTADNAIYNLAGQKISAPAKGQIVIIGGKKVVY
ncbi:MAG: DUF6359 domain-containing protein [Bacteroidaceae bacterium]|nr:DUF6359 domain-containing protein [Bacteroidaceae bacterium]